MLLGPNYRNDTLVCVQTETAHVFKPGVAETIPPRVVVPIRNREYIFLPWIALWRWLRDGSYHVTEHVPRESFAIINLARTVLV